MEQNRYTPRVTLFKGILCDKENKLKKLQVKLKKWISSRGKTVFNIDIQGIRHKFHLQLDFTEQELCFVRLEEVRDPSLEPSCFQCFRSRNYSQTHFSRLLLLFYRNTDEVDGDSECVKVPLIQSGNIHSATTLGKLQRVIFNHIVNSEDVQHWLVSVVTCGQLSAQDSVFFCLTKYAIAVVMCNNYQIMYYHPFYSSDISLDCVDRENIIKIEVLDRPRNQQNNENDNFTFARQYVFRTAECITIEKKVKKVLRRSSLNPKGPSPHWNIKHSELSASGVIVPGTTSDNVTVMPHRSDMFDNNNTSSSGSNGHIPNLFSTRVTLHQHPPPPFHPLHQSGSGMNFSGGSSGQFVSSASSYQAHNVSSDLQSSSELAPRGHFRSDKSFSNMDSTFERKQSSTIDSPTACQTFSGTDPEGWVGSLPRHKRQFSDTIVKAPAGFFIIESEPIQTEGSWRFIEQDEDADLPPPPPCSAQLKPDTHVNMAFKYKPPAPHPTGKRIPEPETEYIPMESGQSSFMRSISFTDLTDLSLHSYVNVQYMMSIRKNVHDDNPYYHFYINVGYVTMSEKLKRRNRMSKKMKDIDFNKLENHEEWYDNGFKEREKDLRFCRINRMNIKVEDRSVYAYSRVRPQGEKQDDPYWTSDLALTLQLILQDPQGKTSALFHEVRNCFDLTSEQLISIQVLLSLVPSQNNWKQLAEHIGLTVYDISIIEHFCFTYRELTARIVLVHWMRLCQTGSCKIDSTHDNLREFFEEMQRDDIRNVLVNDQMNQMENEVIEVTHF